MPFRSSLLLLVLGLLSSSCARAQFGVYGMVNGQRYGGIDCPAFASPCGDSSGHTSAYGGTFGALYDFRDFGPIRLGADLRGTILTSNKRADSSAGGAGIVRQYEVLGGVRGSVATPIHWLRPYAEIGVGYTHNNANGVYTQTTTINQTVTPPLTTGSLNFNPASYSSQPLFEGFIGAEVRITPHIEFRAIEVGLGQAFGSSTTVITTTNTVTASGTTSASVSSASSPSSHGIASIGSGLVIRFP